MRSQLGAACSIGLLISGISAANASPSVLTLPSPTSIEKVDWVRICDRDGDRCRRVWRGDRDDRRGWEHRDWRWWRNHRRDRDRD